MTSAEREPAAVKLPFETGEYLCTWEVPDGAESIVEIPGLLTVDPGKYPNGVLYGKMPISWERHDGGSRAASFPQVHSVDTLVGRLSTGAYVALMNGELSYWFETQGRAVGALAVLSQDQFDAGGHRRYTFIEVQIEGLEAFAGVAPISRTRHPTDTTADREWSATLNSEAKFDWTSGEHQMSFRYDGSFRSFDAYEFRMVFGPVLRMTSATPLTIVEWWLDWVRPLRQLVSLVTSAPREIRYFLASNGAERARSQHDQVFGWDVTQAPMNSTSVAVREIHSSIDLKDDGLSLLDLLTAWQGLSAVRHPLIETYGTMATTEDQHPRSQFLLLLQALEGLHGFENGVRHERRRERHNAERSAFMERAGQLLSEADRRFLDKYLMKNPPQGLEAALIAVFKSLPTDVVSELERTALVTQVRGEVFGTKLRVEAVLVRVRNALSHGSGSFDPAALKEVAKILDRVVRCEGLRILGAPTAAQERALNKHDH